MSEVVVTTIVPVRNEVRVIRETARSICSQRLDGALEVLFVDGRSDDGTREVLEELAGTDPRVRVLDNPQRALTPALNIGLREARGAFVAKMDAHTFFEDDYLALGVERLRRGGTDWVAGPALPLGTTRGAQRVALALSSPLGVGGSSKWVAGDGRASAEEWELDTGVFSGVWRRETLLALGGWDEGWPVNEDAELASRYLATGGRIVCVRAMAARYLPRDTPAGLARQYARYGFYRAKTARRHPASLRPSALLPPAATVLAAAGIVARGRPARVARSLVALHLVAVAAESVRVAGPKARQEAPGTAAALATMHFAWGLGFLAACVRLGLPAQAVRRALAGTLARLG